MADLILTSNFFLNNMRMLISLIIYFAPFCSGACYDQSNNPLTCITSPINAAINKEITATNTCGNPPEGYCYIGPQRTCQVCDQGNAALSHPAVNMVDKFSLTNTTWWQSQTWWTSNQQGLSRMFQPLQVNITLNLNKRYLISGGVYVTFKTERPKKMIIEKSRDFGQTWQVYQYYAKNCRSAYNLREDPFINPADPFKHICSELYSGEFPRYGGVVHFDPRSRYSPSDYYNADVHTYLEATSVRLRLEYPGTDGREYINEESTLNQYFYAISDLRVDARCDCNGHAEFCDLSDGFEICDCKHFTTGDDCEGCLPLYRNRLWRAGNLTHANPCQKCQCFDHATSCAYSHLLKQGICNNCQHNTRGIRCDQCVEKFYRNISESLYSSSVCIPCDCFEPGISDDGKCLQNPTQTQLLGQCNCKAGIYGRRCDQCVPGKWGFRTPPIGSCFDCSCNIYGTLHNDQNCDPYTGQCTCKPYTIGRNCDSCKPGYYLFPSSFSTDCQPCPCNVGGAHPSCNPITGLCACKTGVIGPICDRVQPGYFFPNFTYLKYEPEFQSANGTFSWHFLVRNYARYFTGFGFARLNVGGNIQFSFNVPTSTNYFMLLRYSLYNLDWYSHILPQGRELVDWTSSTDMNIYLRESDRPQQWHFVLSIKKMDGSVIESAQFSIADLLLGDDRSWISTTSIHLMAGKNYIFLLEYKFSSNDYGEPWPLLLDSFILMLDYNVASYYSSMTNLNVKTEIENCFQSSRALATTYNLLASCGSHTFTIDTQLYDRVFGCNCFMPGSVIWNSCATYGGQCHCKIGYGGRACKHCIPGYYGNPATGCIACGCSIAGSLSNACNHETGQCLCKKNAHGLKCNECLHGFFHLSETNPKGCQSCFGYGHLRTCTAAAGFVRSYVSTHFSGSVSFDGWKLIDPLGRDATNLLIKTSIGMEFTDERNFPYYFSAPSKYLGDQLYSYGQLLIFEMEIFPIFERLAQNVFWHVRLFGGNHFIQFKFLEEIEKTRTKYTIRLHQDYVLNTTKISEFQFKAMLGQLSALHVAVVYFQAPSTITLKRVMLETGRFMPSNTNISIMLHYIEHADCLVGYKGLSCETCDTGYTRLIPNGGPLINCVPCQCNNRSSFCHAQSGICSRCRPGTKGNYCEKCLGNVQEPNCDRCELGYWGLFTQPNGCQPCDCFLPGTFNGDTLACDGFSGQCQCNKTINVGGRQCNNCKENSFNISLGEDLRCQECPVCYGLIENSILFVRQNIFQVQLDISNIFTSLSNAQIIPFRQAITSMQMSIHNLTTRANQGKFKLSGLNLLWQTLDEKITLFMTTLQGTTKVKMDILLQEANSIFSMHNSTVYQYYNIYVLLINNYNLLNNTVRAHMLQQYVALHQLNKLAAEMSSFVQKSTSNANLILTKKYELKQKIQLSISAAKQAAEMAKNIRHQAFNLTQTLTPVYTRALEVKSYAETCVVSIKTWLTDGNAAFSYAQHVLASIAITIPDHTVNITALKIITSTLSEEYKRNTAKLYTQSNDINAVALEITKLKTSLLLTQIASVERRSSLYLTNLLILQNKTDTAISTSLAIRTEATTMYNTVRNFVNVAAQAQAAANEALKKVDTVRSSVESALSTALSVSTQIQTPKGTASTALQVMSTASLITSEERKRIDRLYEAAILLQKQTESAKMLVQGQTISIYIQVNLNPLLTQCTKYRTQSDAAYKSAVTALANAEQAHAISLSIAQKITILSTNINNLQTINAPELQNLLSTIQQVRATYLSFALSTEIKRLQEVYTQLVNQITVYRLKNTALRATINSYNIIYQSLTGKTCFGML